MNLMFKIIFYLGAIFVCLSLVFVLQFVINLYLFYFNWQNPRTVPSGCLPAVRELQPPRPIWSRHGSGNRMLRNRTQGNLTILPPTLMPPPPPSKKKKSITWTKPSLNNHIERRKTTFIKLAYNLHLLCFMSIFKYSQ